MFVFVAGHAIPLPTQHLSLYSLRLCLYLYGLSMSLPTRPRKTVTARLRQRLTPQEVAASLGSDWKSSEATDASKTAASSLGSDCQPALALLVLISSIRNISNRGSQTPCPRTYKYAFP